MVVDLVDVDTAALHLAIDAVDVLGTAGQVGLDVLRGEFLLEHFDDALDIFLARQATAGQLVGNLVVLLWLEVAEGEVFQLPLQLPDAEPIGQWRVDLHRLLRDPPTLRRRPVLERLHVVQAIGQLDEHDANVLGHRQEHLAHVLGP